MLITVAALLAYRDLWCSPRVGNKPPNNHYWYNLTICLKFLKPDLPRR